MRIRAPSTRWRAFLRFNLSVLATIHVLRSWTPSVNLVLTPQCLQKTRRSAVTRSAAPGWWNAAWQVLPTAKPTEPLGIVDVLRGLKSLVEEELFDERPIEGVPKRPVLPQVDADIFNNIRRGFEQSGPIYKTRLPGGPPVLSIADPVMVKHIFSQSGRYDKGLLAIISGDIFGEGLITATDREVWLDRRRVIAPGFHQRWLAAMVADFSNRTGQVFAALDASSLSGDVVDMESVYLNLALDIVGKAVFNFDFGANSGQPEAAKSPVVEAVYRVLREPTTRINEVPELLAAVLPGDYGWLLPSARAFSESMSKLDEVLDVAISESQAAAMAEGSSHAVNVNDAQAVDLDSRQDRSLLRFLLDVRGQDVENKRLKDDLRTLLIAGHETVASVLTWAAFELARHPEVVAQARQELDRVLGGRQPTSLEDVKELKFIRLIITETLRLYPAPPFLFRRSLEPDTLPGGSTGQPVPLQRSTLILLQMVALHRNPLVYEDPDTFRPERWLHPIGPSSAVPGWKGYNPASVKGLSPNEISTDFAFVPFGAGEFKCVGDQFAMLEATVILAMMLQRYDFEPAYSSLQDVGVELAATLHPENGLNMRISRREA